MADNPTKDQAEAPQKKRRKVKRPTRFIFKALGFLLVALAVWGYLFLRKSNKSLKDVLNPETQEEMKKALTKDVEIAAKEAQPHLEKAAAEAKKFLYSLAEVKKKIKGKAPETEEDRIALVKEAQEVARLDAEAKKSAEAARAANAGQPDETGAPKKAAPQENSSWAMAKKKHREASQIFAKSGPGASHADRQRYIREAETVYEACLQYCEKARAEGVDGAQIDSLEQNAARCLYTCKKTQELGRG